MKKIIFGLLILLLSVTVFATGWNSESGVINVPIKTGWNLIPWSSLGPHECGNGVRMFVYSPIQNSYFGASSSGYYPNQQAYENAFSTEFKYPGSDDNPYYGLLGAGAMWFYSERNCTVPVDIGTNARWSIDGRGSMTGYQEFLNKHPLKQGWNFINVAPWMVGQSFEDVFQNCSVTSANQWDSSTQNWAYPSSSYYGIGNISKVTFMANIDESPTQPQYQMAVGTTMLLKVTGNCYLRSSTASTGLPPLPDDGGTETQDFCGSNTVANYLPTTAYMSQFDMVRASNYAHPPSNIALTCTDRENTVKYLAGYNSYASAEYKKESFGDTMYYNHVYVIKFNTITDANNYLTAMINSYAFEGTPMIKDPTGYYRLAGTDSSTIVWVNSNLFVSMVDSYDTVIDGGLFGKLWSNTQN